MGYERARKVLSEHMTELHAMADALMKYETIDRDQIADIMQGLTVREPEHWEDNKSKKNKTGESGAKKSPAKRKSPPKPRKKKTDDNSLIIDSDGAA